MDELGIASAVYQNAAETCVRNFLKNFEPCGKNQRLQQPRESATPFEIRVQQNPPSVQIRQFPEGGSKAGGMRIHEKMARQESEENFSNACGGAFLIPETPLILAEETDLTRESIILTLGDATMEQMLAQQFISPKLATEIVQTLRIGHPDFFIIVQRYLLGIEYRDGVKVPYGVVEGKDEKTFDYLDHLTVILQ